jgi:hypothetical protein
MLITIVLAFVIILLFITALSLKLARDKSKIKPVCAMDDTPGQAACLHCGGDRSSPENCAKRNDI